MSEKIKFLRVAYQTPQYVRIKFYECALNKNDHLGIVYEIRRPNTKLGLLSIYGTLLVPRATICTELIHRRVPSELSAHKTEHESVKCNGMKKKHIIWGHLFIFCVQK